LWFDIVKKYKKRPVLIPLDEPDGGIRLRIHAVARQAHGLTLFVVQDQIIGIGGEFQNVAGQPFLVAAPLFLPHGAGDIVIGEVPFADVARVIAGFPEMMRHRPASDWQRDAVAVTSGGCGIKAGLQAGSRRAADRLAGEGMGHVGASARHPVKIRHQLQRISVKAGTVPPLLIGEKDQNVGRAGRGGHENGRTEILAACV
jgi:hypothetical protein